MAIRIRKERKTPYLVYWRNPFTQKLESKSFGTKEEAEKHDALIQFRLRFERHHFRPADNSVPDEPDTLESTFYQYLRERNFEKNNLAQTLWASKKLLEKYGGLALGEIDRKVLSEMQNMCLEAGNKGATVRRKMAIIKAVLNWACKHDKLAQMPICPDIPKSEPARYVPPSPEEISKIYAVAPEHIKRIIVLGYMLGVRVGPCELMSLKWEDVNLDKQHIRVRNAKKGNTDPWREVPIKSSLLPLFQSWHDEDRESGMPYIVHFRGKPVSRIKSGWERTLRLAGISRHIRPYDLRHGFATEAIAAGADYGTVATLMGHKSPTMVLKHYQHVCTSQKKLAVERLPELDVSVGLV